MSFSKLAGLASVIALASKAAAHGTVSGIVADGVYYVGYSANYQYMATQPVVVGWSTPEDTDNGFVAPSAYADPDIICHKGATNAQTSATVAAGGTVELQWTTWPESHHGPMIDYLASCNGDCTTVDKTTLEFFKIDGVGLVDDTTIPGTWGSDQMIANNNTWAVTIPSDIAPGNYVLRHETIALHSAGQADGAQNYPQCFNLEVTGSGTAAPAGTLGTALYTSTDAGILVNIYQTITDYVVPGPALYSGAETAAQTGATSVISSATSSVAPEATGAPATTEAAATSVITSAPVISTGAPFGNGTTVASPQGTGSVSKSLCSKKTKTASATLNPTSLAVQAAATPSPVIESLATSVTIATTSSAVATSTASSSPSTSTPSTEAPSTVTEPEGTTLGDLLSWISSFYSTHKDTEYTGSTVARRHARDIVARKVDEEVFQYREY